jgi:hypothetical protein
MRSIGLLGVITLCLLTSAASAKEPAAVVAGGGTVPLADVITLAKPYPNLVLQVRLQLVRANLKREQVTCTAARFGSQWQNLGGKSLGPYQCPIGKRTLAITSAHTFLDRNGRKVRADDPQVTAKAAVIKESGLTWKWK